jgi:hypothetical protein
MSEHSTVVELRRYTLRPGQRETLVELFDRTFVESQEAVGIDVIGQFRDLDDSDVFTWVRGFPSMEERARALADFYDGETWRAHSRAANATMLDSDDVLLLRPARPDTAFRLPGRRDEGVAAGSYVAAVILHLVAGADEADIVSFFELAIAQGLAAVDGSVLAYFVTEPGVNTFPGFRCGRTQPSSCSSSAARTGSRSSGSWTRTVVSPARRPKRRGLPARSSPYAWSPRRAPC